MSDEKQEFPMDPDIYLFLSWAQKSEARWCHLKSQDARACAAAFLGVTDVEVPYDIRKQHLNVLALVNEYKLSNKQS